MRSKHIAALFTFFATFSISAFIVLLFAEPKIHEVPPVDIVERKFTKTCSREMGEKIREFLLQDKQNGQISRRSERSEEDSSSELSNEAARAYEYFAKSSSMDDSYLPRVFQAAWRKHMKAWGDYAEFLREENYKTEISDDFSYRRKAYIHNIGSTWYKVLDVGRGNCADLPADF